MAPVERLRLKVETNTREHFSVLGYQPKTLTVDNPWFKGSTELVTYELEELMGTRKTRGRSTTINYHHANFAVRVQVACRLVEHPVYRIAEMTPSMHGEF